MEIAYNEKEVICYYSKNTSGNYYKSCNKCELYYKKY